MTSLQNTDEAIRALAYSPEGEWLVSASGRQIQLWQNQQVVTTWAAETTVYALAFSPDGQWLFSGGKDGKLRIWHLGLQDLPIANHTASLPVSGLPVLAQRLHWQLGPIFTLAVSPDAQTIAAAGQDGFLKVWEWDEGERLRANLKVLSQRCSPIAMLQFSPTENLLAAGSEDGQIRLWQPASGQLLATLSGHTAPVTCLGFSPDGRWLATGSKDQTIRLWRRE